MFIYDCEGEPTKKFIQQQYPDIKFGECPIEVLFFVNININFIQYRALNFFFVLTKASFHYKKEKKFHKHFYYFLFNNQFGYTKTINTYFFKHIIIIVQFNAQQWF